MMSRVAINIVTWNSQAYIPICLDALLKQTHRELVVTVLDNASSDNTVAVLAPYLENGVRLLQNSCNRGYAAAHNQLIQDTDSDYVLTLNPDVRLLPDFVAQLVEAMDKLPAYGAASGQLRSVSQDEMLVGAIPADHDARIDEAGMGMHRSRRQYIRGYQQPVATHCTEPADIFGPCGAAAFYRRTMLHDVSIEGEVFDEAFFVHKEDVDLAWRAQLLGWKSHYTPRAIGYHVRSFHPGQRKGMSITIRRHALKNRWLMAVKNELPRRFLADFPTIFLYELQILGYLLLMEQDSLPAYWEFLKRLPRAQRWRKAIISRLRVDKAAVREWFHDNPDYLTQDSK